jgi:hypothetical protein
VEHGCIRREGGESGTREGQGRGLNDKKITIMFKDVQHVCVCVCVPAELVSCREFLRILIHPKLNEQGNRHDRGARTMGQDFVPTKADKNMLILATDA